MVENKINEGCQYAVYEPDCNEWFCELGNIQLEDQCSDCEEVIF